MVKNKKAELLAWSCYWVKNAKWVLYNGIQILTEAIYETLIGICSKRYKLRSVNGNLSHISDINTPAKS